MTHLTRVALISALVLVSAGSCHKPHSGSGETAPVTIKETGGAEMTADEAIKVIRDLAEQGALKTTVQKHYEDWISTSVQCNETELDMDISTYGDDHWRLGKCKSPNGTSPFMKTVTERQDKCCKPEQAKVPPEGAQTTPARGRADRLPRHRW